jgi:hypothetical protein
LGIIFHQQKLKFENLALFSGSLTDFQSGSRFELETRPFHGAKFAYISGGRSV